MKRDFRKLVLLLMVVLMLMACAGATNTTPTNIGVTSYEAAGVTLTQAYNSEKMLLRAGTITAEQDKTFQLGVYKTAVDSYKALGIAAKAVLAAKDAVSKASAQDKFAALDAQLPLLIADVLKFLDEVKK
jgi:hypothetical protein